VILNLDDLLDWAKEADVKNGGGRKRKEDEGRNVTVDDDGNYLQCENNNCVIC